MEIINLKSRLMPGPLDLKSRQLFFLALYDLDNFREQYFNRGRLDNLAVDPQTMAAAETDDLALLEVGMEYVKQLLFKP
jgi:hypothetical protein